jgi:hypothetical protein
MTGKTELAVYETFEDIFKRKSTLEELIRDIQQFSQQSVLWVCAWVVTGVQVWNRLDAQPEDTCLKFISHFFSGDIYLHLLAGYWNKEPRRAVFHRRQLLLIAKLAISHCGGGLDARYNPKLFGLILLKASDHLHYGLLPNDALLRHAVREDYGKIVAEMLAVGETGSPHIAYMITRGHLMMTRFTEGLRGHPDFVDVAAEHLKATGLTLDEFEAMIVGTHARFGHDLARKTFDEQGYLPLKEANFATTAIPYEKVSRFLDSVSGSPEELASELAMRDQGPNDLTVFRKFPLVQQYYNLHLTTAWFGLLMMDNILFLEKINTGPYWNANARQALKLRTFWGSVFERYVNELLREACKDTNSTFIPDPRPEGQSRQLCDGIVVAGDAMVLIEYKSCMFRADTKYSGSYTVLAEEIENKFVHDKEANERKGVEQLAEALKKLFGRDSTIRLPEIQIDRIRTVYLLIVTLDSIGGTIGLSPFLNTFLKERLDTAEFSPREIRPLFCLDIEELEVATEHFEAFSLPEILEHWFSENPTLTAPFSAIQVTNDRWKPNRWLTAEWRSIYKRIVTILFPGRDPEEALAGLPSIPFPRG